MQLSNSNETNSNSLVKLENPGSPKSSLTEANSSATAAAAVVAANVEDNDKRDNNSDDELVLDVTGKCLEFDLLEKADDSLQGLYLYKNAFSLVPRSVGRLGKLRTLKFFGNELNLFPVEFGNLVGLERLQVKVSSLGLNGLGLNKLKGLKELELSKALPRPSFFTILGEIAGLKCLTKLSLCHFSIRYLPPEIGCLDSLEYLDLSFNKIKILPIEISHLKALISLKVSNNKLGELPSGLSLLQRLENLDLSNNRLTSLGSLQLGLMHNLQYLSLQYNKLLSCSQIPSWICCNLEGNGKDLSNDDFISSSVEMDVYETSIQSDDRSVSNGSLNATSSLLTGSSSNNRCFAAWRVSKRWKRRHYLQQRARQERLNNSRKWKGEGHAELLTPKESENCKPDNLDVLTTETCEGASDIIGLDDDNEDKIEDSGEAEDANLLASGEGERISSKKGFHIENCSCDLESVSKGGEDECCTHDESLASTQNGAGGEDEGSSSEKPKIIFKSKRHSDRDLDNPKPCKYRRPTEDSLSLSRKYSDLSFCSIEDRLPDGFYDAGRDRPFMPLRRYEQILHLDSREVILLDREKDEKLDATVLSAQALVYRLKRLNGFVKERNKVAVDNLQVASLLALFVSDHFGGSDRSSTVERTRKAVSGSNYRKPFVCTCSTGNDDSISTSTKHILGTAEDIVFSDLCEKSLHSVKARRNSIVVPLGYLQFGVCRHRALLMKYLCDRMEPPIPCELVRGYLDFVPHAWNTILIKRGDSWVRMLVDACRPHDIREETDPEYFCRYIPLSQTRVPLSTKSMPGPGCSITSFSTCDELEKTVSSTVIQCKLGSVEAAAKVRTLEICGTSMDEIRNFEYSCIGEVRILGALQHSCIVELYGHQISSKWVPSEEGKPERQILQSAILMEYVKGGSLKSYIEKASKTGEKHVPVELALCIARDVAYALAELHSKHIIHRDVKSENILIDVENKRADGMPVVKLCDFDRAVPLRSFLHTCCITHRGVPPPDVCVGTPRWMAPEVLQAMHKRSLYGLEVDIWSYGCLLLELLTLQVPYSGLSEFHINELLQTGKRPPLTKELETLASMNEPATTQPGSNLAGAEAESETLRFLVDLFHRCTEGNPANRPTAAEIYELLLARTSTFTSSRS
uniref:LRR-RLK n=1 Tax=Vernicia fordii TaxID=73154 RepID=A0A127AUM6_VERFO|nr:LRR-RLK [Vernicia fordii]